MCNAYWNLTEVRFTCPNCGAAVEDTLQTHWMGDYGSSENYYALGAPVEELRGIASAVLGSRAAGYADDFIGGCDECDAVIDFGGRISDGAVVEVWPYQFSVDDRWEVPVPA